MLSGRNSGNDEGAQILFQASPIVGAVIVVILGDPFIRAVEKNIRFQHFGIVEFEQKPQIRIGRLAGRIRRLPFGINQA